MLCSVTGYKEWYFGIAFLNLLVYEWMIPVLLIKSVICSKYRFVPADTELLLFVHEGNSKMMNQNLLGKKLWLVGAYGKKKISWDL